MSEATNDWPASGNDLESSLTLRPGEVAATLLDRRPETIELFGDLSPEQQQHLARDAWSIGLRALANAYAQSQQAQLKDVGQSLLSDLERQLRSHVERHQERTSELLKSYFDPSDGKAVERLKAFMDDEGVLARQLERYLAPENSVLARTLAEKVGERSPLLKLLDPEDSAGLVQVLEGKFQNVMASGQDHLKKALDPLHQDGPMARFIRSLRDELSKGQEDREKQLAAALKALDANDENSLLSRLMRETNQAQRALLAAVNPNLPDSPLAQLTTRLSQMLEQHGKDHRAALEAHREKQEKFEVQIREAVTRLETTKKAAAITTVGGHDFEDAVVEAVSSMLLGGPFIVDAVGNRTGVMGHSKVGDLVVRFSAESAFANSSVVFEAKRDRSYTLSKALDELEVARKNRQAGVGVFVMAASHVPIGFPPFARYGQDVVVTWNDSDPQAIAWLQAATICALALASRSERRADEGDIKALADLESRVRTELNRIGTMESYCNNITRDAGKIADELRKSRGKLDLLVRRGREVMKSLNVEMADSEAERSSPIAIDHGSVAMLSTGEDA